MLETHNLKQQKTKLYVSIAILSTKDNAKLTKQLNEGFERSVCWNQYKTKIKSGDLNNNNPLGILRDASFKGVKRLFFLDFDNANNDDKKIKRNSHKKYFLPRVNMTSYNVLTDGRNFHDQSIGDQIKKF